MKEAIETGKAYLFHGRMIYLGEVVEVTLFDIVVKKCCWMQDMGTRMGTLLSDGVVGATEIEIAPPEDLVTLPRGSFARFPWNHELPSESQ